ncbi:septal ring lytic transglycosylase RlpA family protein [Labrenzia sp. 011]|uniref:septal ring lytic transglycosylase RlpA family protein n=1 Tax=Labrenzia sp. 011 TaxID=2171494 RepID=UPI000D511368|nr:septal ring lytic transglycosylase RlpA family protein [Labrenzia sp. 011]PVB62781.1 septal ring lytic transglycosylase RlpA family protein [Labrenzia sp. 011]
MHGIGGQSRLAKGQVAATSSGEAVRNFRNDGGLWKQIRTSLIVIAAVSAVAACASAPQEKAKFSPKKYGVKGSPKVVAAGKPVPKGGGRYVVGKKYKIAGKWYYPKTDPNYKKTGLASWYGPTFHGRKTANGEVFDRNAITAAHTTMPLPSYARVTNLENGRSMVVRVNDRGPFHGNRVIDLSERAATMLGTKTAGVGKVKVEYVGKAPLHGQDESFLLASYRGPGAVEPGTSRPGTMLAQAEPQAIQAAPQVVFGSVPAPATRPYLATPSSVTAYQAQKPAGMTVAFDPAIAFEAGSPTIKVASNNRFEPLGTAYTAEPAPAEGTLGVLRVPAPGTPAGLVDGSAISSFSANKRISDAHALLFADTASGLSMRQLAARASTQ